MKHKRTNEQNDTCACARLLARPRSFHVERVLCEQNVWASGGGCGGSGDQMMTLSEFVKLFQLILSSRNIYIARCSLYAHNLNACSRCVAQALCIFINIIILKQHWGNMSPVRTANAHRHLCVRAWDDFCPSVPHIFFLPFSSNLFVCAYAGPKNEANSR